jgi:hypothetical protein
MRTQAIAALLVICSAITAAALELDNPPLRLQRAEHSPLSTGDDFAYEAGLSPFDYLCTSMDCVLEGRQRNGEYAARSRDFAPPYKPMLGLPRPELLSELRKDRDVRLTSMLFVQSATKYAYAFLPEEEIANLNASKILTFSLRSGEYLFHTIAVSIPRLVPRGLAICKSHLNKNGPGLPHTCVLVAILNENKPLYRAVVAQLRPGNDNPFIAAAYANVARPNELDAESSTPTWGFKKTLDELGLNGACFGTWSRALYDELARDKGLLFSKNWFELKTTSRSIRIQGETPQRISPADDTLWETLYADITIENASQGSLSMEVSLVGSISKDRSPGKAAPASLYQHYYEEILAAVMRSHRATCS